MNATWGEWSPRHVQLVRMPSGGAALAVWSVLHGVCIACYSGGCGRRYGALCCGVKLIEIVYANGWGAICEEHGFADQVRKLRMHTMSTASFCRLIQTSTSMLLFECYYCSSCFLVALATQASLGSMPRPLEPAGVCCLLADSTSAAPLHESE